MSSEQGTRLAGRVKHHTAQCSAMALKGWGDRRAELIQPRPQVFVGPNEFTDLAATPPDLKGGQGGYSKHLGDFLRPNHTLVRCTAESSGTKSAFEMIMLGTREDKLQS